MDARARHSAASGVSGVGDSTPSAAAARSPLAEVGPPAVRASRRRAADIQVRGCLWRQGLFILVGHAVCVCVLQARGKGNNKNLLSTLL